MKTLTIHRAAPIGNQVIPDLSITATEPMPKGEALNGDFSEWAARQREKFEREAQALCDALVTSLPGGTIDQLLRALLQYKASLFRVAFRDPDGRTIEAAPDMLALLRRLATPGAGVPVADVQTLLARIDGGAA